MPSNSQICFIAKNHPNACLVWTGLYTEQLENTQPYRCQTQPQSSDHLLCWITNNKRENGEKVTSPFVSRHHCILTCRTTRALCKALKLRDRTSEGYPHPHRMRGDYDGGNWHRPLGLRQAHGLNQHNHNTKALSRAATHDHTVMWTKTTESWSEKKTKRKKKLLGSTLLLFTCQSTFPEEKWNCPCIVPAVWLFFLWVSPLCKSRQSFHWWGHTAEGETFPRRQK